MASSRVAAFKPDQLWQQAREPMFWLDSALRVVWVNQAWETLTGCPAEALVGQKCPSHGPSPTGEPSDLAASLVPPPEAVAGQPSGSLTLIHQADGESRWRRVEFWPFRDREGTLIGLLGQVREVDSTSSVPDSAAHQLRVRLLELRRRLQQRHGFETLIGTGPAHARLLEQVRLAASTTVPVLIIGEPGTGKRLVARTIHQLSAGRHLPLVPFDCEALPAEVLERELFAARRQAEAADGDASDGESVTRGASRPRLSLSEGSALLISDILSLPRDLQARLAGSLDGRVRLLATTAGDPEAALKREQLRPELYYAMTVLVLRLLPLRERRSELLLLAQHLLERANQRGARQRSGFTPEAAAVLAAYDWPGNLRELARVIDHAHAQPPSADRGEVDGALIGVGDLPATIRGNLGAAYLPPPPPSTVKPLDELLTEIERRLIEAAMSKSRRNKSKAAELLGISRPRLYRRIKELNLPDDAEIETDTGPVDTSV